MKELGDIIAEILEENIDRIRDEVVLNLMSEIAITITERTHTLINRQKEDYNISEIIERAKEEVMESFVERLNEQKKDE